MAAEEVGGLSLPITADFSGLDADFQAAIATAVSDGATLAEAINRALKLPDTTPIQDALATIGTASEATVGQLSQAAKGMEDFGQAANSASQPIAATAAASTELGSAAQTAAAGATEAGTAWASFGSTLLGLAGITFTIGALRELVVGSIEAADKLGDTQQAIARLTGDADKAAETIGRLRDLAQDEGLAFPSLLTASTRLTALLPEGTDVVNVLGKIGNAAELFGTSIEAAGRKFSNIVEGGQTSARVLGDLGLKMDDIRDAMTRMGASADLAFKDLNQTDRLNVLTLAMGKLDGAAKDLNNDISGDWTRTMNQARDIMAKLGDVISPLAQSALPGLATAMKIVETAVIGLFSGAAVVVDFFITSVTVGLTAIQGLGKAWKDAMTGNFTAAALEVQEAFDKIKNTAATAFDGFQKTAVNAANLVTDVWKEVPKITSDTGEEVKKLTGHYENLGKAVKSVDLVQATHAFVDIAKAAADGMLTFETATQRAWDKVGLLAASQEHINELLAVSKARFDAGQMSAEQYGKVLAEVDKINKELVKSLDAVNLIAKQIADAAWAKQMNDAAIAAMDLGNNLKALGAFAAPIAPIMSETNRVLSDFHDKATNAGQSTAAVKAGIDGLIDDLPTLNKAFRDGVITQDQYDKDLGLLSKDIQQLAKTDLPLATQEMGKFIQAQINAKAPLGDIQTELGAYEGMINKLAKTDLPDAIAAQINYIQELNQVPHSLQGILSAETQLANMEIQMAQERGQNADQWILGLERIKLQQESLRLSTVGWASVEVGLIGDMLKGFDSMTKAIADNLVDWKNWGDVGIGVLKNFAKSIMETLVNGAFAELKKSLIDLIIHDLPDVAAKLGLVQGGMVAANAAATHAAVGMNALGAAAEAAAAQIQASIGTSAVGGGLGSGLAGSVSHLASIVDVIADVISAGAAVASTIILSHISSDTGHIEVNTRGQLAEAINLRADLWQQYNTMYDRLGECKNALDGILMAMQNITVTASALPAEALANLAQLPVILGVLGTINSNVLGVLADANLMVLGLQNINDNVFQVHNDLGVVIGRLDTVITSLIYGNHSADQASRATMDSFSSFSQSASQIGHGIIGAIDEGTGETARGTDVEISAAEAARTAAARAYASATSLQGQLAGLQAQIAADNQLAAALTRSGNASLAATYTAEANKLSQDVRALLPQLGTMVSSTQNVAQMVGQLDLNSGGYIANSTTQIVGAVYGAASVVAAAVGAAYAAGGYATGEGTTTKIPKGTGAFPPPVTQTGNPGNSGAAGGPGPNGGGGYVTPLPPTNTSYTPPNPQYPTMHNPDGSVAEGNLVPQQHPARFDPLDPFTWPSTGMTKAQQDAINQAHMPSFDVGGPVTQTGPALVHAGEFVLSNDMIDKITGSGGAGDSLTAAAARLALALQAAQIAAEMQQTAAADMRAAQITQLTASKAMAEAAERQSVAQQELSVAQARAVIADEQKRAADAAVAAASGKSADEQAAAAKQAQIAASQVVQAAQLLQIAGQHITEASVAMQSAQDGQREAMMGIANAAREQQAAAAASNVASKQVQMAQDAQTKIAGGSQLGLAQANSDWSKLAGVNSEFIENQLAYAKSIANWRILSGNVPSFDNGGIVGKDMLSLVHKDEMVLPPDISMMLRGMATTPALPGRVPSYPGVPAAGQGGAGSTIINMPVTFNGVTDAKQLMDMWTQRVKLLIPRATVFSS